MRLTSLSRRARVLLVLVILVAAVLIIRHSQSGNTYAAYFDRTTGLYVGDQVKVLGVKVGSVTKITEESTRVRVEFEVDASQKLPQNVEAALVAPSLVTGRFVQLAPVYSGGPVLRPGGSIPESRTAVPVEFDQVKQQVTRLARALGPQNGSKGALNDLISIAAKNLDANTAKNLRDSLRGMSQAVDTISSSRNDIFKTVQGVDSFVSNLVANEANLRSFSTQLDTASTFLADNRGEMAQSISLLQGTLRDLTTFVKANRGTIATSVQGLTTLSRTLADEKIQLANALHRAPTVMDNYYNIQDPYHGGVIGRPVLNYFSNVAQFTCGLVLGVGGTSAQCSQALQSMLQALHLPVTLPGSPGNPVLTPDGSNPLAPALTGTNGLSKLVGGLAAGINGSQSTPGLLGLLLGGGR